MDQLKRVKYLMEFHFKPSGTSAESEYPTFDNYIDEIVNEEDPTGDKKPEAVKAPEPQQPKIQATVAPVNNKPVEAPVPAPAPMPIPEPAPMPAPAPVALEPSPEEEEALNSLNDQNNKMDIILKRIDDITGKVANIEGLTLNSVDSLKKEVDDLKEPTYEEQLDMISQNSYPYNIKLSDYFNWNEESPVENKPLTITPEDIKDYSPLDIKKSF